MSEKADATLVVRHKWTPTEERFLREHYGSLSAAEVGHKLRRSKVAVRAHIHKLRLAGKLPPAETPAPEPEVEASASETVNEAPAPRPAVEAAVETIGADTLVWIVQQAYAEGHTITVDGLGAFRKPRADALPFA
jgi:hypothetical protein